LMEGAHKFIERKIAESVAGRSKLWHREYTSRAAYEKSVEPNHQRFSSVIGVEDKSAPYVDYSLGLKAQYPAAAMEKVSDVSGPDLVAETPTYRVYAVRWPVLNRVNGEGLLLQPKGKPVADIIAIPDAGQTPEQLVGLSPGIAPESQFARHLAENGFQVLVPVIISRSFLFEGEQKQQTYREWIYRQAFHMGRHVIGYEVQKVMSAVDWFKKTDGEQARIGVAGYEEGGLIAFYSAAVDKRIDAVMVSGYFQSRTRVWDEPIYRNVWRLRSEFGDAEIASLIAPRALIVEYSTVPRDEEKIENFSAGQTKVDQFVFTGYKGKLETPAFADVESEYERLDHLLKSGFQKRYLITGAQNKATAFGSKAALERLCSALGYPSPLKISDAAPADSRKSFDADARQKRQLKELEDHVQWLLRVSDQQRNKFFLYNIMPEFGQRQWSTKAYHPYFSPDRFIAPARRYRQYFREEILGKFSDAMLPADARTRKVYDREKWTGYEVVLNVYEDFSGAGLLLIPKDLRPGERRPVVVAQHGRNGTPQIVVEGNTSYNDMAAKLADQGFVVFAPYGLFNGEDQYRFLDRKANTIGKTLFSFIVSQHEQYLSWLGNLPFVDKARIAFYGKSYGGETAMRVPPVLEGYCLSICSADFGDWSRKVVDAYNSVSFMNSFEWEMPYFNMGSTFSYAEMAYLIFPRPFMVERGHDDLVQPDEWVAYEFAKVKYLYDRFNRGDNAQIEYFNGGHASRNEGTFKFLHKFLDWP
ncbi:MAG TPA: dienelactone hydrolase family protein, partial [Chryseosolibacter sp.]